MFDILNKFHIEGKQDLSEDIRKKSGWVSRLKNGLARTAGALSGFFSKEGKIYDGMYEDLEATLIAADVGMDATYFLLANLKRQVKEQRLTEMSQIKLALSHCLVDLLKPFSKTIETGLNKPFVIMVVGVNGVGKTTSIGKLAKYFQEQGKTVLLAAGDTFRVSARRFYRSVTRPGFDNTGICRYRWAECRGHVCPAWPLRQLPVVMVCHSHRPALHENQESQTSVSIPCEHHAVAGTRCM